MGKIKIDSAMIEIDKSLLEKRLNRILSSTVAGLDTVRVTISLKSEVERSSLDYRCEIEGIDGNSQRFLICKQHRSLQRAMEEAANSLVWSLGSKAGYS